MEKKPKKVSQWCDKHGLAKDWNPLFGNTCRQCLKEKINTMHKSGILRPSGEGKK